MNRASSATGWVRNPDGTLGWTWNPITGCLNGCEYCYARKLANGRLKPLYLANPRIAIPEGGLGKTELEQGLIRDSFYPRIWQDRIAEPLLFHKPRGIFTCDMSDLFGLGIPKDWTEAVLYAIKKSPQHRFYLLTKQPQNLIKWSPFPRNVWVGATVTDADSYRWAMAFLSQISARIKFLSIEPFLSQFWLRDWEYQRPLKATLDLVIIGQQTPVKQSTTPKLEWIEEIAKACNRAGIPYFLKDNLAKMIPPREPLRTFIPYPETDIAGGVWKLRQEMPLIETGREG